jgi:hypothetical protein
MGAAVDRFAHNSFALLAYAAIVRIYDLQLPFFDRSQGFWGFIGFLQSLMMTFGVTLVACLIGSRIPDWIDSGDCPGHRGFGRSLLSFFHLRDRRPDRLRLLRRSGPRGALCRRPRGLISILPVLHCAGLRGILMVPLDSGPLKRSNPSTSDRLGLVRWIAGILRLSPYDPSSPTATQ